MKKKPDPEVLSRLFPGGCFFGPFVGFASAEEMRTPLAVLRFCLTAHALLDGALPLLELRAEQQVYERAELIEGILMEEAGIELERGEGYSERLNNSEYAIPGCGVWNLKIPLTEQYKKWLAPHVDMYNAIGSLINSERIFYLLYNFNCEILEGDNPCLLLQIYGMQSLRDEYSEFLEAYEGLPDAKALNGYELYGGLIMLADTLATLHLAGSMPVVLGGALISANGLDSLTDLWVRLYDDQEAGYVHTGACEVCGRLFVSGNPKMHGHASCMNRQRVMRSRARKYQEALDKGLSPSEASKAAKISSASAETILGCNQSSNCSDENM